MKSAKLSSSASAAAAGAAVPSSVKAAVAKKLSAAAIADTSANNRILFTRTNAAFGCFSNFTAHVILMPMPIAVIQTDAAKSSPAAARVVPVGDANAPEASVLMPFPTNEHYFQAMKFPLGSDAFYACADASTPAVAKKAGGNRSVPIRTDWNAYRHTVMLDAIRAKFMSPLYTAGLPHAAISAAPSSANALKLQQILLSTGDAELVEHSAWDKYWGDGGNGNGQNHLGKTIMRVREEIRKASLGAPSSLSADEVSAPTNATVAAVAVPLATAATSPTRAAPQAATAGVAVVHDVDADDDVTAVSVAAVKPRKPKKRLQ